MKKELDNVFVTLSIGGTNCESYKSIRLTQKFNDHHTFEAVVDYECLDSLWFDNPEKIINLIGEPVQIVMTHKQSGGNNTFVGVITQTAISGYHGQQGDIIIRGCSPTIKMDGCRHMDSFMDKTLKLIVDEVAGDQGNGASVVCKPVYSSQIDYVCQYDQTAFEFLNYLSYIYGEIFFYDGEKIYFGNPMKTAAADIIYDIHLEDIELCSSLMPGKFSSYDYLVHDDKQIDSPAPDVSSTPYGNLAKSRSESVYSSEAFNRVKGHIKTKKDLDDLAKADRTRQVGGMHFVKGTSQSCKVKIGEGLNISLPSTMEVFKNVGNFMTIEVEHMVGKDGRYQNRFVAIPVGTENIPMREPRIPMVGPQIATVKDNNDEKKLGRVKVETQWQTKKGKTSNWIRVQTPDAGKSDKVPKNRGMVHIPEVDDLVMLGFEYGDPSRPFVMGSIFSEKVSGGGGDGNKTKSLTTRTGSTITFDDAKNEGSITISDPSGNSLTLNGDKTINISAPDKITLSSGSASITLESDGDGKITLNAKTIHSDAGETFSVQSGKVVSLNANESFTASGTKDAMLKSSNETTVSGQSKTTITATGQTVIDGAIVKLN